MHHRTNQGARWAALGLASLLVQDKFHGLDIDGRWLIGTFVLLGVAVCVVLLTWEPVTRRLPIAWGRAEQRIEPQAIFPDVEFAIQGSGFKTITENVGDLAIARIVLPLIGVRMVNHESERRVSLTFRAKLPIKAGDDAWDTELFPRTKMPFDLAPQSSLVEDVEFDQGIMAPGMEQAGSMIVEVEDHLSGLRTPIPTMGKWRPARDGLWTGAFPAPPPALLVKRDRPAQWSNFKHRARIVEQHLAITNQTDVTKTLEGFFCESEDGMSIVVDHEVRDEVEKRKSLRPELRRHAILEPGDTVEGWAVHAFRYTANSMPTFTLGVIDELGQKYEAE